MRSKRLYLLTIFYIAILAAIFKWLYPEVRVTALATVIAILGFAAALGSNFLINRRKQKRGEDNDE
jgi:Flp pilus assembly protein TadB